MQNTSTLKISYDQLKLICESKICVTIPRRKKENATKVTFPLSYKSLPNNTINVK